MKYERIYSKGELIGYKCEKANIEIYWYDITPQGNWHKNYIVPELEKIDEPSRFDTLKEAKQYIEMYL